MASHHILTLPRELRDQIYIHLLAPTGFIILPDTEDDWTWGWRSPKALLKIESRDPYTTPASLPITICLSFTRVCKQIYCETKDFIWRHNTLVLQRPEDMGYFLMWPTLTEQLKTNLVHVELHFDPYLSTRKRLVDTQKTLETLVTWSHPSSSSTSETQPALKSISLRLKRSLIGKIIHKRHTSKTQDYLHLLSSVFNPTPTSTSSGSSSPSLALPPAEQFRLSGKALAGHVQKVLTLDLPPEEDKEKEKEQNPWDISFPRPKIEDLLKPERLLLQMHVAFGGQLWIDGRLRYKEGASVL